MSDPQALPVGAAFTMTGNPATDNLIRTVLLSASAGLTGVIITWLGAHGFVDPNLNALIGLTVFSVLAGGATALWGYLRTSHVGAIIAVREAVAVQAGINLTTSGNAVDARGNVVSTNDGTTPPKPVDLVTTPEIIKNFAGTGNGVMPAAKVT